MKSSALRSCGLRNLNGVVPASVGTFAVIDSASQQEIFDALAAELQYLWGRTSKRCRRCLCPEDRKSIAGIISRDSDGVSFDDIAEAARMLELYAPDYCDLRMSVDKFGTFTASFLPREDFAELAKMSGDDVEVNDHGNITVTRNGKEIWSLV